MSSFLKSKVTAPEARARARRSGTVSGDDPFRTQEEGTFDGKLAHGAASPDGDCLAPLQIAKISGHEASREDIRQKEDLLVAQALGHFDWADIGIRYAQILRLAARVAAQNMR